VPVKQVGAATAHLRTLAGQLKDSYVAHSRPRAALLVGSAATGEADFYSDLDLLFYYDDVPGDETLAAARSELGAERDRISGRDETGIGERFYVGGVQCQLGHLIVGAWEQEIAKVVAELQLDEPLLKAISGLFEGSPLHGAELIERWREQARYTERVQRAMIEKHWKFFPWWYYQERLGARDATAWRYDVLAHSVYNIVGLLAALNRVYFSTFEFKRAGRFLSRLEVAPPALAERLNALFESDERRSTAELEELVSETQALVATRFPDLDLALEWGGAPTPPGEREAPWEAAAS
jgi:hypothetical protein